MGCGFTGSPRNNFSCYTVQSGTERHVSFYPMNQTKWYHVVYTHDSANGYNLYINGSLKSSDIFTGVADTAEFENFFGTDKGGSNAFRGQFDELKAFNYTLSASDVHQLYNNGTVPVIVRNFTMTIGSELVYSESILNDIVTINLTENIRRVLNNSCTCTSCVQQENNYCSIPFNFVTASNGTIEYSLFNGSADYDLADGTTYATGTANFTIRDEINGSIQRVDIDSVFNHTINNSFYSSLEIEKNNITAFNLSMFPSYASISADYTITYGAAGFQERILSVSGATFSSTWQNITLWVLNTGSGIYTTIQLIDQYQAPISRATIQMKKTLFGNSELIESRKTDDSGQATIWSQVNTDYQFTVTKAGCTSLTTTFTTVGGTKTLQLDCQQTSTNQTFLRGVTYDFSPSTPVLTNNTLVAFNFNATSTFRDISSCSFYLQQNDTTIITNSSVSFGTTSCDIVINYNVGNLSRIIARGVMILNGSEVVNVTTVYGVAQLYQGNASLKTFLNDISAFSEAGFNNFTRMIIALVVIIALTFAVAGFAGLTNPDGIIVLIVTLVWIFSYVNWLTVPGVFPLATLNKYIIFYIVFMVGASMIVAKVVR